MNLIRRSALLGTICGLLLVITGPKADAAKKLSVLLKEADYQGIVGKWVDAETQGKRMRVVFRWKIKDRILESTTVEPTKQQATIVGVNGKTDKVFIAGGSSDGTTYIGDWGFKAVGESVQGVAYTTGAGQTGAMSINYQLGKDSLMMSVNVAGLPQPIRIKLVRAKK